MATVKAFVRKNSDKLFVKVESSFDGMVDGVMPTKDNFRQVKQEDAFGSKGVWVVGSSNDYITAYEDNKYIGFKIGNCCGSGLLVTLK